MQRFGHWACERHAGLAFGGLSGAHRRSQEGQKHRLEAPQADLTMASKGSGALERTALAAWWMAPGHALGTNCRAPGGTAAGRSALPA